MLRPNEVRHKLGAGEEVYGLFSTLPEPTMVEMIGCAGYDFVILDTEHTLVDPQRLENLIRAAETAGLTPFVRVPEADPGADIDATIRAARYAPEGMRSLNGGRGPGFGRIDPAEYLRRANAEIMVIALLEDAEGIEAIDEILSPGGVDLVLPGPGDLSQSYGVPWQVRHPRVQEAVRTLREACARHTVPFCAMSTTPDRRAQWRADGVTAFVVGEDRDLTARALRGHLARTAGRE